MSKMDFRGVEQLPLSAVKAAAKNARRHSRRQVRQIADSIERFGFTNPILIEDGGAILAGQGRAVAAKLLGLEEVPCIRLSRMTEAERLLAGELEALDALWRMGRHKCGAAKDPLAVERFTEGEGMDMLFTEPPYNVRIDDHISGPGHKPSPIRRGV